MKNVMRKTRRMLGVLMSVVILLTGCISAIASETNPWLDDSASTGEMEYYDILPEQKKAIEILGGLGIIEDVYYYMEISNEPISRIDAAQLLYNFSGASYVAESITKFEDIGLNNALNYVVSTKIMQGTSESTFSPDATITYAQMCKVIATFMGYGDYAEYVGGYPDGYLKIATERRLIDAVISDSEAVTVGEFALVLYNLFDDYKLEIKDYGENSTYQVEENDVLYQNLKIKRNKAVVNGLGNRATGKVFADSQNRVYIGYDEYIISDYTKQEIYDLSLLVGRKVEYYYSADNTSDCELVFYYVDDNLSNVTTIKSSDINGISNGTILTDDKKYSVESSAAVMKNYQSMGKTFGMCSQSDIIPKTGHIDLIDNDNNGSVDFCHIISYVNVVVDTVSVRTETVTNKYRSDNFVIDTEYWVPSISKNGKVMKLSDIEEWSALGVMLDSSGQVMGIDISPYANIEGCADALEEEKCYIGDKAYHISTDYVVLNKPSMAPTNIKLGVETTFIINPEGEIIAVQAGISTSTARFAYIVAAGTEWSSVKMKAFTQKGAMETFDLAKKVTVDGTPYSTKETIYAAIAPGGTVKSGMAIIKVNSDNKVREILYPVDVAANPGTDYDGKFTFDAYFASRTWIKDQGKFEYSGTNADPSEREFWVNSDAIVFGVPASYNGSEDDGKFFITDASVFYDNANYSVSGYNIDDEYNAGLVVARLSNTAYIDNTETPFGIITGEFYGMDANGEYVKGLKIFFEGSEQKLLISQDATLKMYAPYSNSVPETISLDSLKRGDTVRIAVNKNGEIGAVAKHLPDTPAGSILSPSTTHSYNRGAYTETTYGRVVKRSSNTFVLGVIEDGKEINLPFRVNSSANIYVYDIAEDEIYKGDVSDIPTQGDGAYAIVMAKDNAVSNIVVYLY